MCLDWNPFRWPCVTVCWCVCRRDRVQSDRLLREPDSHQPQLQLQLHALTRHGPVGTQAAAARPEPTPTECRHWQHDAGVLQERRVWRQVLLFSCPPCSLALSLSPFLLILVSCIWDWIDVLKWRNIQKTLRKSTFCASCVWNLHMWQRDEHPSICPLTILLHRNTPPCSQDSSTTGVWIALVSLSL